MPLKRTGLLIRPDNTIIRIEYTEKKDIPEILELPQDKVKTLLLGKRLLGFCDPELKEPINESGSFVLKLTTGGADKMLIAGNLFLTGRAGDDGLIDCPAELLTQVMLRGVPDTVIGRTPRFVETLWPDILVRAVEPTDHYLDVKPNYLRLNVVLRGSRIHDIVGFF